MSPISDHRSPKLPAGFTLVEIMVATGLSVIVIAAIFSAYTFMGRNLTRLVNTQEQSVASRRTVQQFTTDVGAAISLSSTTSSNLTFTVPATLTNCATTFGSATVTCASTAGLVVGASVWAVADRPTDPMVLTNCATTNGSATITCASTAGMAVGRAVWPKDTVLTNCATTTGNATVTSSSTAGTAGLLVGMKVSGTGIPTNAIVSSINANGTTFVMSANATASNASTTLTVASIPSNAMVSSITDSTTFVMSVNAIATTTGGMLYTAVKSVPAGTVVSSITNGTTFVMSANATATTAGATLYTTTQIRYLYDSATATLKRTDLNRNTTTTLLSNIDTSAGNGFTYYNEAGNTVTSATTVKSVEFSFTTKSRVDPAAKDQAAQNAAVAKTGSQSRFVTISPRVVLRNKLPLQ